MRAPNLGNPLAEGETCSTQAEEEGSAGRAPGLSLEESTSTIRVEFGLHLVSLPTSMQLECFPTDLQD
jgi:hypothetical protein